MRYEILQIGEKIIYNKNNGGVKAPLNKNKMKNDQRVEDVQNAIVTNIVGDLEICFEYENETEIAHIVVMRGGLAKTPLASYSDDDMTIDRISTDFPQFFKVIKKEGFVKTNKTVRDYIAEDSEENSGHIIKKAILINASDRVGSYMTYADIEGSYMAVYSYWEHNIEDMTTSENAKWVGYELVLDGQKTQWLIDNYGESTVRLIVPQWVMSIEAKDEFHAKSLFTKYLKRL